MPEKGQRFDSQFREGAVRIVRETGKRSRLWPVRAVRMVLPKQARPA